MRFEEWENEMNNANKGEKTAKKKNKANKGEWFNKGDLFDEAPIQSGEI